MKKSDVRRRTETFRKMSLAAALLSGLVGEASCSSRPQTSAGDGGIARGGQAGSSSGNQTTGGAGGAGGASGCFFCAGSFGGTGGQCDASVSCNPGDSPIASDSDCLSHPNSCYVNEQCGHVLACRHGTTTGADAGGSTGDSGGAGGLSPWPIFFPLCNPGDQQIASGVRPYGDYAKTDLSGNCPAERECYSLDGSNGPILCMLPEGVHCKDPLACDAGDTEAMVGDAGASDLGPMYKVSLCDQFVLCASAPEAGVHAAVCSGTWSNGIPLEPPDASTDGNDAETISCCGDGIIEPGEECDFGVLNDVPVYISASSLIPNPDGTSWCNSQCRNPHPLCVPYGPGGMYCD